jgi:hypothetical protein
MNTLLVTAFGLSAALLQTEVLYISSVCNLRTTSLVLIVLVCEPQGTFQDWVNIVLRAWDPLGYTGY